MFQQFKQLPLELQQEILTYQLQEGLFLDKHRYELVIQQAINRFCSKRISSKEINDYILTLPNYLIIIYKENNTTTMDFLIKTNDFEYKLIQYKVEYIAHQYQEEYISFNKNISMVTLDTSLTKFNFITDLWSLYQIYYQRKICATVKDYGKNSILNNLDIIYNKEFHSNIPYKLISLYLYLYLNIFIWSINTEKTPNDITFDLPSPISFDIHYSDHKIYTNRTLYHKIINDIPRFYQILKDMIINT